MPVRKALLRGAAFAGLLACAAPAQALVTVIGNTLAHDCFTIAKTGKDPVGGINTCNSAIQNEMLSPHDRAATMINRASMEMQLNRVNDAMADYNKGIEMFPTMGDAYVDRAGAFISQGHFSQAMTDIEQGLSLGPTYPFVGYYNRAIAEQLTGNYTDAYKDYQKVLEMEPAFTPAADHLKDINVARAGAALSAGAPAP